MSEHTRPTSSPEPEPGERGPGKTEDVVRGRAGSTPFVLLGGVALTVWAIAAALMGLAVFLIWWLV